MKAASPSSLGERSEAGFSLVEVALAIGIIAFAFVPVFSLLPLGMGVFREATNISVSSQILQKVLADVRQSDFSQLVYPDSDQPNGALVQNKVFRAPSDAAPELRYFDDQGNEVIPSNAGARQKPAALIGDERLKVLYHVNTRLVTNTMLPAGVAVLPAQYLATVTVQIAVNPDNRELTFGADQLFTPRAKLTVVTYSAQIAKND